MVTCAICCIVSLLHGIWNTLYKGSVVPVYVKKAYMGVEGSYIAPHIVILGAKSV
jgi:hypothetical protein